MTDGTAGVRAVSTILHEELDPRTRGGARAAGGAASHMNGRAGTCRRGRQLPGLARAGPSRSQLLPAMS